MPPYKEGWNYGIINNNFRTWQFIYPPGGADDFHAGVAGFDGVAGGEDPIAKGNRTFGDFLIRFNNLPAQGAVLSAVSDSCVIATQEAVTIPNTNSRGAFGMVITIVDDTENIGEDTEGALTISLADENGAELASLVFNCVDEAEPVPPPP